MPPDVCTRRYKRKVGNPNISMTTTAEFTIQGVLHRMSDHVNLSDRVRPTYTNASPNLFGKTLDAHGRTVWPVEGRPLRLQYIII